MSVTKVHSEKQVSGVTRRRDGLGLGNASFMPEPMSCVTGWHSEKAGFAFPQMKRDWIGLGKASSQYAKSGVTVRDSEEQVLPSPSCVTEWDSEK